MQIATQIAPTRYLVGRAERGGRYVRRAPGWAASSPSMSTPAASVNDDAGHAWLRLVRIIWVTVKMRMMTARISDSAAPYPSFRNGNELR